MARPQLWVLAGGNGAGKSTFYREFLKPRGVAFVNADEIARTLGGANAVQAGYEASAVAAALRERLVKERESFCFETVFSHPSKVEFLGLAKALDYEIQLVIVHLENDVLNRARVRQRVSEGGHDVPPEKVVSRIPRTLAKLRVAVTLCDRVYALDNSRYDAPFLRVFTHVAGCTTVHVDPLPPWAAVLVWALGHESHAQTT